MRCGIYARVSTTDKGQDVELQLKDLRNYVTARGWGVHDEYVDIGESGAKDRRPELDRLLEDARKRKIDGIAVWRLDRFGRSLKHLINTLDELRSLGITFVSYSENLDFSTSTGQLLFHLLGAFAEFERGLIRERIKAGLQNAKAKGIRLGRCPLIDSGLLWTVKSMRDKGISIRGIAKSLNVSKSTVHKTLKILESKSIDNSSSVDKEIVVR
jgi:DNA invertase Pin-like site-specific DNA recombinase